MPTPPDFVLLVLGAFLCALVLVLRLMHGRGWNRQNFGRRDYDASGGVEDAEDTNPPTTKALTRTISPDIANAASAAYVRGQTTVLELEQTGAVLWTTDEEGTILRTAGGGLVRFGVIAEDCIGSNMRSWPNAAKWDAAVKILRERLEVLNVNFITEGWLVPAYVTVARRPEGGGFVAISIPLPNREELEYASRT